MSQADRDEVVRFIAGTDFFGDLSQPVLAALADAVEPVRLDDRGVLFDSGETSEAVYIVDEGTVHLVPGADAPLPVLARRRRGDVIGIPLLAGRVAWLTAAFAAGPVRLYRLDRLHWERLLTAFPDELARIVERAATMLDYARLDAAIRESRAFGHLGPALMADLKAAMELRIVPRGADLFRKGDQSDYLYLVVNGRLHVLDQEDGTEKVLGELDRGDVFGEIGVILGGPRNALIRAARDSMVARLGHEPLARLLRGHPEEINRATTIMVGDHLLKPSRRAGSTRPTTLALVPGGPGVDPRRLAALLEDALAERGSTLALDGARLASLTGLPDAAAIGLENLGNSTVVNALNELEHSYDNLLLVADGTDSPWTHRCLRQADKVLLAVDAAGDPTPGRLERALASDPTYRGIKPHLLLLHRPGIGAPHGTLAWLEGRDCAMHHHLRDGDAGDVARLARFLTGQAVGLVLGGGGARGFAHVGVLRALDDLGIPVDLVGGTSMGAFIAAQYALHWSPAEILERSKRLARSGDSLTLPIVSLFSGRKGYRHAIETFGEVRIEDLWRRYFAISCNLSRAGMVVHHTGLLRDAVAASNSAPGLFPPFHHREGLLVDGAFLNNVPVDVMAEFNPSGSVLAVDVNPKEDLPCETPYAGGLSGWRVLFSRLNPFSRSMDVPNMVEILLRVSSIGGLAQRERGRSGFADLYLQPPVAEFSLMDFRKADRIAELGYAHARPLLEAWLAGRSRT